MANTTHEASASQTAAQASQDPYAPGPKGTYRTHSGQGHLVENIVLFVVCMALLCGSFVLFSMWQSDQSFFGHEKLGFIGFTVAVVAYLACFFIPLQLLRSKTSKRSDAGKQTTMQ